MPATTDAPASTTTIRAGGYAHAVLRRIAQEHRVSLTEALDTLAREHEDKQFWEQFNAAYAAMTPEERAEDLLEGTLMDGLADE